ncbi:hypothetical protein [Streptomyces lateritius]|uniref:hypothetical protein n=1 Tax=Streptomyces lateritius TaxID=67313 RepID=UPI001C8B5D07|nr:hypothetical protein [Streptomyces lateritius]MBX9423185.1 hypothetical protein [Streptomyces lateritius]
MKVRYAMKRRGAATVVTVAAAALLLVGCGGDGNPKEDKPPATSSASQKDTPPTQGTKEAEEPSETLAVVKGQDGFELAISTAIRDAGGFLTLKGTLKNTSSKGRAVPDNLRGDETEVLKHGTSLGGATLVDAAGKKRYYVLRDTDGRPLTTTGLGIVSAGESVEVFMQFPAPPATTTEVSFQLPTFEPATLKLS